LVPLFAEPLFTIFGITDFPLGDGAIDPDGVQELIIELPGEFGNKMGVVTQPGNLFKGITVIDINHVYVMFLPGVAGREHVAAVGELELDDAAEDDLAVVADG
jgi:hypothetical protein